MQCGTQEWNSRTGASASQTLAISKKRKNDEVTRMVTRKSSRMEACLWDVK